MPRKKIEVVELNKKEDKIILAEEQSALILFWRRHSLLIFLTLLILSLTIIGISIMVTIKNMDTNVEPKINEAEATIDISLTDFSITVGDVLTEQTAKDMFLKSDVFSKNGEVLLVKTVEHSKFTIKYYSDGMALKIMKDSGNATRINPLPNGEYGINNEGITSSNAKTIDITLTKTEQQPWGTVRYYSDGSAEVINSKMDMFVRNANDINKDYISNNKVAYLKESKNVGNVKLNYYYDGTIQVVKDGQNYIVRTADDLNITDNDVTFKNNNEGKVYKTLTMSDGVVIDYYDDGGAIIKDGNKTLSVRKSNSIIIKDNKIYEIIDNKYVEVSKKKDNVTYYTNGGAVVENHNENTLYIPENSDIKYQGNNVTSVGNNPEKLVNETNDNSENVKTFENTAVVKNDEYIAIVPKDKIIYDTEGKVKEIIDVDVTENTTGFTITNNSNEKINYRVAIQKSDRTTVDISYLRFQISNNNKYIEPTKFKDVYWTQDNLYKALDAKGDNYILINGSLEPYAADDIKMMLWADYDTIPNSQQDKYFYGTIRVYAWTEEE